MHPRLDLRDGEWWIAVVSVLPNFTPTDKYNETICIKSNLTEPLLFGEKLNLSYKLSILILLLFRIPEKNCNI